MDLTGEDRTATTRAVDDLERLGLVVRKPDPADRRAHAVELTDAGRRRRAEAGRVGDRVAAVLLAGFGPAERDTLMDLLERLVAPAERSPTGSTGPHLEKGPIS
jgi:DNA-binding MarR family transcriptional regulator